MELELDLDFELEFELDREPWPFVGGVPFRISSDMSTTLKDVGGRCGPRLPAQTLFTGLDDVELEQMAMGHAPTAFCTTDNLNKALSSLSKELVSYGFPSVFNDGLKSFDTVQFVNIAYELLQHQRQSWRVQEELENRVTRVTSDVDHLHTTNVRLRSTLEQTQKNLSITLEKERQLRIKNKTLTQQLKSEKDEVKRINSIIQQKDSQYLHDVRKREREMLRLRDRLSKVLSERPTDRRLSIEVINNLPRKDGTRGKWKTSLLEDTGEKNMYNCIIKENDDQMRFLVEENIAVRELLADVYKQRLNLFKKSLYQKMLQRTDRMAKAEGAVECETEISLLDIPEGQFFAPFAGVQDLLQKAFAEMFQHLEHFITNSQEIQKIPNQLSDSHSLSGRSSKSEQEIDDKLEKYEDIISIQDGLLQQAFLGATSDVDRVQYGGLADDSMMELKDKLLKEKALFDLKLANFESEREAFTKAAQQKYEAEKAELVRDALEEFKTPPSLKRLAL